MKCFVFFCALALAGCASPPLSETGPVTVVPAASLPAPTQADLVATERPHLIGPFDRMAVEVFGIPDLSREVRVDTNGRVSLPLAGEIEVNGKTTQDVARVVTERLRTAHVRDPRVTVNVIETVSQTVTVDGEVKTPGIYPLVGRLTLMRAIARASGTTEFAAARHVVVFRTVDNRPMAALYDLQAIRLGAYQDPEIYPNDLVVVGESQARRLFPQILQAGSLLLAPLVTYLNNN